MGAYCQESAFSLLGERVLIARRVVRREAFPNALVRLGYRLRSDGRDVVDPAMRRRMCDVFADYFVNKLLTIEKTIVGPAGRPPTRSQSYPRTDVKPPLQLDAFDVVYELAT